MTVGTLSRLETKTREQVQRRSLTKRVEERPRSSQIFSKYYSTGDTSYALDYTQKPLNNLRCVRTLHGRNNPHPSEAFLVWHLPSILPVSDLSLTQLMSTKIALPQEFTTTYQEGYVSTLERSKLRGPRTTVKICEPNGASSRVSTCSVGSSTMQSDYQMPRKSVNLSGNTTRYGCSEGIVKAAQGVVPTLVGKVKQSKKSHQTWYTSEFGSRRVKHNDADNYSNGRLHLPPIASRPQLVKDSSRR